MWAFCWLPLTCFSSSQSNTSDPSRVSFCHINMLTKRREIKKGVCEPYSYILYLDMYTHDGAVVPRKKKRQTLSCGAVSCSEKLISMINRVKIAPLCNALLSPHYKIGFFFSSPGMLTKAAQ